MTKSIKMKTTSLSIFLGIVLSFACSNREERDRALQDLELKQQELLNNKKLIEQLESEINRSILELEVAKDDLQQVKQFQLMRMESEREQQIKDGTQRILDIQKYIEHVSSRIQSVSDSASSNQREIIRLKQLIKG
jgi:hypothetical protein